MVVASTRRRRSSGAGRGGALPLHAMRVLAVAVALPRVASESECPAGSIASITGVAACCPARCGRCGGKNCHQLADGHQSCCAAYIQKVGRTCNGTNPPCIPGQHGGEKPRFAHAALGPRSGPIKDGAIVRCAYRPNATFDAGTAGVDTTMRATGCALHWVTVSPNREPKWHSVWKDVCHEHIVVPEMNTSAFWPERWRVVWRFLTNRPDVQHLMLTDTDIHVNPYTASEILERFDRMRRTKPESVVVATEETCWIGHVCSRQQVARFQNAHSSKGRFIQSQYIGRRTDLLHMLEFGIASSESDDQRRIFDYSLAHPERVTLDYGQILFGSLALTELDALGHFVCGDGKCKSKSAPTRCISTEKRVCLAPDMGGPICPISWHGNGPFARDFLIRNRPCRGMLRFGTKHCTEAERFANVVSREDESNMMRLLDYFSRTCERHGIEYVIDGGTLVGSMLHHGRIPWDDDLDVYVRIEDRSRLEAAIDTHEYKISHHVGNGAYSKLWFKGTVHVENHRAWNWPFVDIGWLVTNETHAWEQRALTGENNGKYRRNVYPKTWLFPPVTRPFGSLRLSAPRESERFLEYRFTSGWNNTCVVAHWDHRLEIWRYRDSGPTVAPCDTVSVDLVRRSRYPNGSSVEELTSSDERLVAVGRFEDDSLVSYSVMPSSVMPSKTMVHEAFSIVTLISGDNYVFPALTLLKSIKTHLSTGHTEVNCLHSRLNSTSVFRLQSAGCKCIEIQDISGGHEGSQYSFKAKYGSGFNKIYAWSLDQYDKILFLDSDTVLVKDVEHMFRFNVTQDSVAATIGRPLFNSGVMLLMPSKRVFAKLKAFYHNRKDWYIENETFVKRRPHDQQILGHFFTNNELPRKYNCIRGHHVSNCLILHNNGGFKI